MHGLGAQETLGPFVHNEKAGGLLREPYSPCALFTALARC